MDDANDEDVENTINNFLHSANGLRMQQGELIEAVTRLDASITLATKNLAAARKGIEAIAVAGVNLHGDQIRIQVEAAGASVLRDARETNTLLTRTLDRVRSERAHGLMTYLGLALGGGFFAAVFTIGTLLFVLPLLKGMM